MIRGTTPTFKLLINDETLDLTQASGVYASFEQGTTEILKTGNDLTISCTHGDTGTSTPSSSLGSDGDIYLKVAS